MLVENIPHICPISAYEIPILHPQYIVPIPNNYMIPTEYSPYYIPSAYSHAIVYPTHTIMYPSNTDSRQGQFNGDINPNLHVEGEQFIPTIYWTNTDGTTTSIEGTH